VSATEREAVAIIGIAGRFPGAPSVAGLHDLVFSGREGLTDLTSADLLAAGVTTAYKEQHESWIQRAGVIDRVDLFDAARVGVPPREAELMDPQHRIFLEICHEAIEDAGYLPGAIPSTVGLFAGCSVNSYLLNVLLQSDQARELQADRRTVTGNDRDYFAAQVAYRLDLRGPVLTVQSACSTSLAAVHMGVEAILSGQCDMALAGGVCIRIPQRAGMPYRTGDIQSADGRCRPFTAAAAGVVNGSGAGVVVLKGLAQAIADADPIRAVVLSTAMSNDGRHRTGFTAPSPEGQARVIAEALALAGVAADSVGYMEAHGTATALGDRVELNALRRVFGTRGDQRAYCALGSVKSNVGHLDTANGVAGIAKLIGAFERQTLPPSPHADPPHPDLHLEDSPFFLLSVPRPWNPQGAPRRAGISSFGMGGTNVHALLEEAPPLPDRPPLAGPFLLCLSAHTAEGLLATAQALATAIEARPALRLEDVALTLATSRAQATIRAALVVADRTEALLALRGLSPVSADDSARAAAVRLTLLCRAPPSQGMRMAESLALWDPQFARDDLVQTASAFRPGNPAATVFLMTAGDLLRRYGASPDLLAYTADGAVAAAYLACALSRDAALRVAAGDPPPLTGGRVALLPLDSGGEPGLDGAPRKFAQHATLRGLPADAGFVIDLGSGGQLRGGGLGPFDDPERVPEGLLRALGAAWCAGARIDLARACARPQARRASLPPSHAERESFWIGNSLGEFAKDVRS
jgi:acyl transferase domain-containing protein